MYTFSFENMHSLLQLANSNASLVQLIELVDANPSIKMVMREGIDQFNKWVLYFIVLIKNSTLKIQRS